MTSYDVRQLHDIRDVLDCLCKQTFQDFELVYVTEGERLLENSILRMMADKGIRGKVLHQLQTSGLGAAREIGARSSSGRYLLFLDDDVLLPRNYLAQVVETFVLDSRIVGVTTHALPLPTRGARVWLPAFLHWDISCTTWFRVKGITPVANAWGHAMAFNRSQFFAAGGFPQNTGFNLKVRQMGSIPEDIALSLRIRHASRGMIIFNPALSVYHKVGPERMKMPVLVKRAIWVGGTRRKMHKVNLGESASVERRVLPIGGLGMMHSQSRTRLNLMSLVGSAAVIIAFAIGYFRSNQNDWPSELKIVA